LVRSPLAADHAELGAVLTAYHGVELPSAFSEIRAEYNAVRLSAGVFDFSFRSKFILSGEHRVRFLHRILSNDIKGLNTGEGRYALLLNAQGRVLADLRVYADDETLWVDIDADIRDKAIDILRRYVVGDRVEIAPVELWAMSVQGPFARQALEEVLPTGLAALDCEMYHCSVEFGSRPARVVRLSSTGERGYEIWLDAEQLTALWRGVRTSGVAVPCGCEALETLRIEAGIPRYGPDFGEDTIPLEAGLWDALSFNKGCYIGQEIVERTRSRGHVNWKLMGFCCEAGAATPVPGGSLTADAKAVGEITSACFSPALGRPVGIAYLRREFAEPGRLLGLASGACAEVTGLPFVRRGEPLERRALKQRT
jgi:glycine cleavage system T protein